MSPPAQAGSQFAPFTPVPGVFGVDQLSIEKKHKGHKGSRSMKKTILPRRQISPDSLTQEPPNPRMSSEPPSAKLVPSLSVTTHPMQGTSQGRLGAYHTGLQSGPTGRQKYTFWPDGTVGYGHYGHYNGRNSPYRSNSRLTRRMMSWFRGRPSETAGNSQQLPNDRQPREHPSNTISNHQECGDGSICHNLNIAGNGVTVNTPPATYTSPFNAQSLPNNELPESPGTATGHIQSHSRHVANSAPPPSPPPPAPRPPRASFTPEAAASFWASAGQRRASADRTSARQAGQGRGRAFRPPRRACAAGPSPQEFEPQPRWRPDLPRQGSPAPQGHVIEMMGARPRSPLFNNAINNLEWNRPSPRPSGTDSSSSVNSHAFSFPPTAARSDHSRYGGSAAG